jgi:DNA-binding response OmpR family regulator
LQNFAAGLAADFMPFEHPLVFLLEDSFVVGAQIERTLLTRVPECRLLWARTIEEAHVRSFGLKIALFVLDVELPDGNGLDFLLEMRQTQPAARAIVLSSADLVKQEMHSPTLGVLRFVHKPVEGAALAALIKETLAAWQKGSTTFRANLNDLSPIDVLQLKCLAKATTVLEFHSQGESGRVHIDQGTVIHAEMGSLSGVEALNRILSWKGGQIGEKLQGPPVTRTIHSSWESLLMEAAQAMDEAAGGPPG